MKKTFTIILYLINFVLFAQIIEVKQDSTGNYLQIQDAVENAINGDTILIWPGIYYENVDLLGKSLTLGSLTLTTGDINYKYSTIINGNQSGTCVLIKYIDNAEINGLTLTNGAGHYAYLPDDSSSSGGGIYCRDSDLNITNCIITNNNANRSNGGILVGKSNVLLSGTSITYNKADGSAGGIGITTSSTVIFDPTNRCNIYGNMAATGNDIAYNISDNPILNVIVDTFSVLNPGRYFAEANNNVGYPYPEYLNFDILNQKITPFDGDLYVDPQNGSDENSGISENEPLKTIFYALSKIVEDSLDKNTIYLANGNYSDSANGEKFPLNIRSNVLVEGESMDGVIWDGRSKLWFMRGNNNTYGYGFSKITMKRGRQKYSYFADTFWPYIDNSNFVFDSITVTDCRPDLDAVNMISCNNAVIKNSVFKNTLGGTAVRVSMDSEINDRDNSYTFINCKFINNIRDPENPYTPGGVALNIGATPSSEAFNKSSSVINCLFEGNRQGISSYYIHELYVVNSTFVNNSLGYTGGALGNLAGADAHIYNSIFYNNGQPTLWASNYESSDTAYLNIYNSLVENGEESIEMGEKGVYYYAPSNIDTTPGFLGMWGDPYMLSDNSPCIDKGTLTNLPDFIELPEYDLAGNPRIFGDSIDMGAYEWNPTIVGFHDIGNNKSSNNLLLSASPNPFNQKTEIRIINPENDNLRLEVYNNYGQLIRNILATSLKGEDKIYWHGNDSNGNKVSPGLYHIVMFKNNKETESLKVVKR